jgi:DNA-binding CsgD family transcriptional regulator
MRAELSLIPLREQPLPLPPAGRGKGSALFTAAEWYCLRVAFQLSRREIEMVQGVFDDRKDEQIAHRLAISRHTVNTYLQRLYKKLRVNSRPQLILKVVSEYLTHVAGCEGEPPPDSEAGT